MKKIYNKFLIVSTISLFLCGIYLYFSKDLNGDTILPVAMGSSLDSSNNKNTDTSLPVNSESKIDSDISFLKTIASIKNIDIDTTFFTNPDFIILNNNEIKIDKVEAGRINPFAPIQ